MLVEGEGSGMVGAVSADASFMRQWSRRQYPPPAAAAAAAAAAAEAGAVADDLKRVMMTCVVECIANSTQFINPLNFVQKYSLIYSPNPPLNSSSSPSPLWPLPRFLNPLAD